MNTNCKYLVWVVNIYTLIYGTYNAYKNAKLNCGTKISKPGMTFLDKKTAAHNTINRSAKKTIRRKLEIPYLILESNRNTVPKEKYLFQDQKWDMPYWPEQVH